MHYRLWSFPHKSINWIVSQLALALVFYIPDWKEKCLIGASAASPYLVISTSTLSVYIYYVCHGPALSVTPIKSFFTCEDGGELICYSCSTLIHFHAFANQLLQLMVKISCAQSNLKTFSSRCACPKHALHAPSV